MKSEGDEGARHGDNWRKKVLGSSHSQHGMRAGAVLELTEKQQAMAKLSPGSRTEKKETTRGVATGGPGLWESL